MLETFKGLNFLDVDAGRPSRCGSGRCGDSGAFISGAAERRPDADIPVYHPPVVDVGRRGHRAEWRRAFVSTSPDQVASYRDSEGISSIIQVVLNLLNPTVSESSSAFVGRLVSTLVTRAGTTGAPHAAGDTADGSAPPSPAIRCVARVQVIFIRRITRV